MSDVLPPDLTTEEVLDRIFRDPSVRHGLTEFEMLDERPERLLDTVPRIVGGEPRYFLSCLKRGVDIQVLSRSKSSPEEIVRQLWLHLLTAHYGYPLDRIDVEHEVTFGTVTADKAADILVYEVDGHTPKIVIEVKKPKRKDGLEQLKSYLNAEGSPVGVWSNGRERVILYRPYPQEFDDTLTEIPRNDQEPRDVLREKVRLDDLRREFDFKRIVQNLEELVLANAGIDEFNEIFKLVFAKLYDELEAENRREKEVLFRKHERPEQTYQAIDDLFYDAMAEWPGIFDDNDHIRLTPQHLQVVVGPMERIRLLGANMRIMDDAFEYLVPSVAKRKNGQFFTPRYVIDMAVKMLQPKRTDYVLDPACGSAGFLVHAMEFVWPANEDTEKNERKYAYASRYLWGIDNGERLAKVARALMLIAGDGRSKVFQLNALDPREWFISQEGERLRGALREASLLTRKPPANTAVSVDQAWDYYRDMKFDVILTNPPFAGEIRDKGLLRHYDLAGRALGKKNSKEERDVLFIERCFRLLKPGGRIAIILPQGKFNSARHAFIRDWILRRFRILAIVGLHPNTFKPHTGQKTSVLFAQKYTEDELERINKLEASLATEIPSFRAEIESALAGEAVDQTMLVRCCE